MKKMELMEEMVFKKRESFAGRQRSQGRYLVEFEMEDLCPPRGAAWEIFETEPDTPNRLILEMDDLESISIPSVSWDMEDLTFPVVNFNMKELTAFEEMWKAGMKKFDMEPRRRHPFSFHGTRSKENVKSICKNGWKVGSGNAYGSGIYFGFVSGAGKKNKNKIPVPGLPFNSNTAADGYTGGSGALIVAEVDWGNSLDWNTAKVQKEFGAWCAKNRSKYSGGDAVTEFGLSNGYDSVRCPNHGFGVMLQHQYALTKRFWKTDKIRICYVYGVNDKKVDKFE